MKKIRVVVWNEYHHEKTKENVREIFPEGIHNHIKSFLEAENRDLSVKAVTLSDPDQGLPDRLLEKTDVLIWWGHVKHNMVSDELTEKIRQRVYLGKMGFIALHSAHHSKPFRAIVGTNGNISWGRNQREIVWNLMPSHPIAAGIPDHFLLDSEELYSEPFFIPQPDELVFGSWYEDGNILRSGVCFRRGVGKVFYFQPGHETCRSFFDPNVKRIISNAVHWAAPVETGFEIKDEAPHIITPAVSGFATNGETQE